MTRPYYLAGPMTGYPSFNYPLFDTVAESLRDSGYDIQSPAEMDDDATRAEAMASPDGRLDDAGMSSGQTWGDFLSRDVKLIADGCSGIILLPRWYESKGARLEVYVAMQCGYPVLEYVEGTGAMGVSYAYVLESLRAYTIAKGEYYVAA